ncbi:MAG: cytochrome c oxidase subunit II [Thiohalocapsa sp.]|uniref:cytochrome c oxidase subunit II n=1 Tax=Thiohalocapsa sp. TaxID=2497641 RepID=UPI0025E0BFC9|nr:cytochrome c oxidase subunit II [Thiohalocapsa sp.]MCG6940699.1 cytochrome c oxidase subunit II [Thiohalocapsa sp.]
MSHFERFIAEASSAAGQTDALLLALTVVSVLVVGGISLTIAVFAVRWHAGSKAPRGPVPDRSRVAEGLWIGIPLLVFLGIFIWAAVLFHQLRTPPPGALAIDVVAKQWMWKIQHPDGQREINELHIPVNRPIELVMTSQDVIHSFFVPAFRIKQDVLPGRYTTLSFTPIRTGRYQLFCAEFCGTNHSEMRGTVIVMSPSAFSDWLAANPGEGSLADQGAALFREYGCSGCHGASSTVHAPKLNGLYGHPVMLANGTQVTADARYIRDSILLPASQVAAGYTPIMPSFKGQVSEEDILKLVAYIRSLSVAENQP